MDKRDKLEFMTAMVQKEMDFAGYSERLLDYIIQGLDCGLDYFFSLLENSEIYKQVYYAVNLETMLSFLSRAVNSGYNLTKQKNKVQDLINEIKLAQVREESRRENAAKPKVSSPKRDDDIPSVVDIIMDGLERKINEDGMTNEELYNRGMRSEMDRETDKRLRDFLKNPLK